MGDHVRGPSVNNRKLNKNPRIFLSSRKMEGSKIFSGEL